MILRSVARTGCARKRGSTGVIADKPRPFRVGIFRVKMPKQSALIRHLAVRLLLQYPEQFSTCSREYAQSER